MRALFALFPLFSAFFLFQGTRSKFTTRTSLVIAFSVASFVIGEGIGLPWAGLLYGVLFLAVGLFPIPLRKEIRITAEEYRLRENVLKNEVAERKQEYERWMETRRKVVGEMERISKRYEFAKTLVSRIEERPILLELSSIFGSQKIVMGLAFSTYEKKGDHGFWKPFFTSGWVTEEDWKKLLDECKIKMETPASVSLPQDSSFFSHVERKDFILVSAPVKWAGETQGVLTFLVEGPLPKDFLDEVSVYAQLLGLGLHKTYLYRLVVERSRRDGLTNLYLRSVFMERLHEEINFSRRYGTSFSILILDLDHFKAVNDSYGHPIGDKVLKSVADCLKSVLHPGVTIARYGGEEFAVLIGLAPVNEVMQAAELARRSIERLVLTVSDGSIQMPVRIGKRKGEINITASVGIAHYLPETPSPEELIRRADAALYWAKEAGRNCVREWKKQK